jgi:hypothetical protein
MLGLCQGTLVPRLYQGTYCSQWLEKKVHPVVFQIGVAISARSHAAEPLDAPFFLSDQRFSETDKLIAYKVLEIYERSNTRFRRCR